MSTAEDAGATTTKLETIFEDILNAIWNCLSDLASSDDEQDGDNIENNKEDTVLGKLSDDDEPGWAMGTTSNTVQHHIESFL
jgi:hypothetical protein